MPLALFTSDQWNGLQVAGAQASSKLPLDFRVGSNNLAVVEGSTASLLYLQANIVQLLAVSRASTCFGTDLDSFFADFDFPRLQPTYATGSVTLARDQAGAVVTIPADGSATVLYNNGTPTYTIVADTAQPTYDVVSNSYIAPVGATTITVTAVATTAGTVANIPANGQFLLGANTGGFDTAYVATGFSNAVDIEQDDAYRARFVLYLQSLSRATIAAISSAILNTQQSLAYTIANNQAPDGSFEPGNFVVTIDDGSGNPPASLIAAVDAAVTAFQGNTISHNTRGPSVVYVVAAATLTFATGTDPTQILPTIEAGALAYINGLGLGNSLSLTKFSSMLYGLSPSITNVTADTLNGVAADLNASKSQVIKIVPAALTLTPVVAP